MDCGWESSDDERQMEIDLEAKPEEHKDNPSKQSTDAAQVSQPSSDPLPEPADDYDPAEPTSDAEESQDRTSHDSNTKEPYPSAQEISDYDPADPTISDEENLGSRAWEESNTPGAEIGLEPENEPIEEIENSDGRWDSQISLSQDLISSPEQQEKVHNSPEEEEEEEETKEEEEGASRDREEKDKNEVVSNEDVLAFDDNQSSKDESFRHHHVPTTPPLETDENTQTSNISLENNIDDSTSDVPEVTFDESDFVLEKEPFESTARDEDAGDDNAQHMESSGWRSVDSQGEENSWTKLGENQSEEEREKEKRRRQEEAVNRNEEALVDLFREESEPDKEDMVEGEVEQPQKRSKKKLGSKKLKKKGKKLKKGVGKKGQGKVHSDHGDQRFVEISRERPSVESKEDGELDLENVSYGRKKSHDDRLGLGLYDHQVLDIGFTRLEEEEQREPGEIVETDGKKKGSKKKDKKERKKKKARREVATIEDGHQGDDDSQKFPSFLAGFFVQDEGEEELEENHDSFANAFDEEEARMFHKNSVEKNYRKHQESGPEDSVRSFDQNLADHLEGQERRVEEVEHRRSRKHDERRHESRERHHGSREARDMRYEKEHRHDLAREKDKEREKERSRSERGRERGRDRDRERERERERDRERERERMRRLEFEERRRRGSKSRSAERHRRSRSHERSRRSRSRDRSSRQRRRRSRSYDRSAERERERERERDRERSRRRQRERSHERDSQRRVRRTSYSRSRSPRRRAERASSNKENRDENHRRRRQRYQEESESEDRGGNRRLHRHLRRERESSSSSSSSSQSSSSHPTSYQNTQLNHSFPSHHSSDDEGASSDVILVEPERIVINLDEEEDPPSRVDITHANAEDDSATLVDGESIPPPPEMSGSARASALIQINPEDEDGGGENLEDETGDATPTRDEASDIARTKRPSTIVQESDYDPAHPTEEDGEPELVVSPAKEGACPPSEKGPVPPDHPPPEEVRPSPPPVPADPILEPPPSQPPPPMPNNVLPNPVMRLINPLLLQQQQQSNHQQQPGLLPFPNLPGQPPRFMNWPVNQNNSGQPPSTFGQGQRHMRPLLPTPDGHMPGFRADSSMLRPPFSSNSLQPMSQQTGPGHHPQMPISSMPPLAQLTSLLPALEKAKLAVTHQEDSSQPHIFKSGGPMLGKPPLSTSMSSNMSAPLRASSYRGGRPDLSESTEVVDMDMSPGDDECELELPSPNSDSNESKDGRRRRGRRGESHQSKNASNDKSGPSTSNKGVIQPVVYLKALSKFIEKLTPKGQQAVGAVASQDKGKQSSSRKRRMDVNEDDVPASAVDLTNKEKYMRKLHLQERVIDEVKLAIKPFYSSKKISKEQYKLILRKAVPKICHSKSGNINPQKIQQLVEAYVGKMIKGKANVQKKKRPHPQANREASAKDKDATTAPVRQNGERAKKAGR